MTGHWRPWRRPLGNQRADFRIIPSCATKPRRIGLQFLVDTVTLVLLLFVISRNAP
jgi:hypothetical protein